MKQTMYLYSTVIFSFLFLFCTKSEQQKETKPKISKEKIEKHSKFNEYWYAGKAEITSYKLTQVRYGEIHTGIAVNIFVTESFLPNKQVKADYPSKNNIPILKLNSTKKYNTGIYPYSLMTSTFSPINMLHKAIKISFSAQEWCGNTFVQLNNEANFQVDFYSYFESDFDKKISLKKNILENELWNLIRISPKKLPIGKLQVIPSFEYLGLHHKKFKAYEAIATLKEKEGFQFYSLHYPLLKRTLTIKITENFPYTIESWEETLSSRGKLLTTNAIKIKTIQSAYWNKNKVANVSERKELKLD